MNRYGLIYLFFLLLLSSCSDDISGGSGTNTGNANILTGIVTKNTQPLEDCEIRLVPINFNPLKDSKEMVSTVYTDKNGKFSISLKENNDKFTLECQYQNFHRLETISVSNSENSDIGKIEIKKFGVISVGLPENASINQGYVFVRGTTYFQHLKNGKIIQNGKRFLTFSPLPEGLLSKVEYGEYNGSDNIIISENVNVRSGEVTIINNTVKEKWSIFTKKNSPLTDTPIKHVAYYKNELLLGTAGDGIKKLKNAQWEILDTNNSGLQNMTINRILHHPSGKTYYIGTHSVSEVTSNDQWIISNDLSKNEMIDASLKNDTITAITSDQILFKTESNPFVKGSILGNNSTLKDFKAIYNSTSQGLLLGNINGVFRLQNFVSAEKLSITGFENEDVLINQITEDHTGNIWCATSKGILMWDGIVWKHYNPISNNNVPNSEIISIHADSRGRIWCGSKNDGTIILLENDTIEVYSDHNFEILKQCGTIISIEEMESGKIAFGTNKGLLLTVTIQ